MENEITNSLRRYLELGVTKVAFSDLSALTALRDSLTEVLQKLYKTTDIKLENLHNFILDDDREEIGWKLSNHFWKGDFCRKVALQNCSILSAFTGPDLYFQTKPFLRIARPGVIEDNIGFHRDTLYGQSPFEVSVHVPLMGLDAQSCLKFWKQTHVRPDSDFTYEPKSVNTVKKGSKRHEMGFPYEAKSFEDGPQMEPLPLKFGEVAIFPPSTVHGQMVNLGSNTRVSFDFRIVSRFAPVEFRKDFSSRGYSSLTSSEVVSVAERFLSANSDKVA